MTKKADNGIIIVEDAIDIIRENPGKYFPGRNVFDPIDLCLAMISDLLYLKSDFISFLLIEKWYVIRSKEWIPEEISADQFFKKIIPFPEAGINSFRSQIILAAFSEILITKNKSEFHCINGKIDNYNISVLELDNIKDGERMIAFIPQCKK